MAGNSTGQRQPVYYTDVTWRLDFQSASSSDPLAMQHIYTFANWFIEVTQPPDFPKGVLNSTDNILQDLLASKDEVMWFYRGLIGIAAAGLLLAVIVPLAGIVFAICRCCGRCGRQSSLCEHKYDACRRATLGFTVIALGTALLFGIVCGFVTNEYVEQGVQDLPSTLNNSLDDIEAYLNSSKEAVNNLLVSNYAQLENTLGKKLDECGRTVKDRLAEVSQALAIDNLTNIVSGLQQIQRDVSTVAEETDRLQQSAFQLELALTGIQNRLSTLFESCGRTCQQIHTDYDLRTLVVQPDYWRLPNVSAIAEHISEIIHSDIEGEVRKGKASVDNLSDEIQHAVNNTIPGIKQSLRDIQRELTATAHRTGLSIDSVDVQAGKHWVYQGQTYLSQYSKIRHIVGALQCCAVLLITSCIVSGLCCGFCGRKPNYIYGDEACTKATGGRFLLLSVYLIWFVYALLMAVTTLEFVVGTLSKRTFCDPIVQPRSSEMFKLADSFLRQHNFYNASDNSSLAEILERCHQNLSAYQVLNLQRTINLDALDKINKRFHIEDKLNELTQRISINPSVMLLTNEAKSQLLSLAQVPISAINFTMYSVVFEKDVTKMNVQSFVDALRKLANEIRTTDLYVSHGLLNEVLFLDGLQVKIIASMQNSLKSLKRSVTSLQEETNFNRNSLELVVSRLVEQTKHAQDFINRKGHSRVIELAKEVANDFQVYIEEYTDRVKNHVKYQVGSCWPVSQAVNASVAAVCLHVVSPWNGLWASMAGCLLIMLPTTIVLVYLATLYRKSDQWIVPLTDTKLKKRLKQQNSGELYENANGFILTTDRHLSGQRYGEYLPANQYDYPVDAYEMEDLHLFRNIPTVKTRDSGLSSSGRSPSIEWLNDELPPRYSSATNLASPEYDRPPPYYFPGPGGDPAKY